ncbi:MAG: hypothetical protein ACRDYA_09135 [Egibacteraceae bacterium]
MCFRHVGGDEVNQAIIDRLNASGRLYLSHTRLAGRLTLRLAIGAPGTERRHVEQAWATIRGCAGLAVRADR